MSFFKKYPNLRTRLIVEFFFGLFFWMFFPFLAIYFSEELGKNIAGILLITSQAVSVIVGLFGGYLADTKGRKVMMVRSFIVQSIGLLLLVISAVPKLQSAWLAAIGFTFVSLADSLYRPASSAMIVDSIEDDKERQKVFSIFYTNMNISVIIGPLIGGIFFFSNRLELYIVSFFVVFVCTIVLVVWIKETNPGDITKKESTKNVLFNQIKQYKIIFTDKLFLLFILAGILLSQTFMQLDLLLAVSTKERVAEQIISFFGWGFKIDGSRLFSWVIVENGILVTLFTILITAWMKKYSEKNIFVVSSLFYAVSMIVFGFYTNFYMILFAMLLFSFAELMSVGVHQNFIGEIAPEDKRGQYFAAGGLRYSIGRMIAPTMIPLTVIIGFKWTFITVAILAAIAAYIYHIIYKNFEKSKKGVKK